MEEKEPKEKTVDIKDLEELRPKFSLGQDDGRNSRHFLRIKVTEGALTSDQLLEISKISDEFGKGQAWITNRQSIQLHWIEGKHAPEIFSRLDDIGLSTDKCGQAFPEPGYGDMRNICTCPVSGFEKNELVNVRPIAQEINEFFIGNEDFLDMPKKFKVSISSCNIDCTRSQMQDLGFFGIKKDGKNGFGATIGGSIGVAQPGAVIGKPLNVFIKPEEVFDVTKKMVEIHRDYSNTEEVSKARFKWLVDQWGVKKVRDELEKKLGKKLEKIEYNGPKTSRREHIGVNEQKNGKYYVTIPLVGGKINSEKLRTICELSNNYGTGEIRTTPYQNLIILNISKTDLDKILKKLKKANMPVEGSNMRWDSIGCASDFCANSKEFHPKKVVQQIVDHLEKKFGKKLSDYEIRIGISGCGRDCGMRNVSDLGFLATSLGEKVETEEYMPFVGGRFGSDAKFSKPLGQKANVREIKTKIEKLVKKSLEKNHDSFKDFLDEYDLEELKQMWREADKL